MLKCDWKAQEKNWLWLLTTTNIPSNDHFLQIPTQTSLMHHMTLTLHHAAACLDHTVLFIYEDLVLLVLLFTLHFSLRTCLYMFVSMYILLNHFLRQFHSLWLFFHHQLPATQCGHTSSFFQDSEKQWHPVFYPTLPREAITYSIHGSSLTSAEDLFVMSLVESGCSFHKIYSLSSFFEKVAEYLAFADFYYSRYVIAEKKGV